MSADPFGTAGLRHRALAAWTASPVRLREDANAEDDSALSSYHDRLVVELAQNAADAARRGGVAGALRLTLDGSVLYAANPGVPLDRHGVEALSHRRVSTKSGDDVGRYGVGFAAVLSVTDEPSCWTPAGGISWSRSRTAEALSDIPEVAAELRRRDGQVPVMRLPWEAGPPEDHVRRLLDEGASTVVRLPLRDDEAVERTRAMLSSIDPLLLLFLDGLDSWTVDGVEPARSSSVERTGHEARLISDGVSAEWMLHTVTGELGADLMSARPVEERERRIWALTWAVPIEDGRPRAYEGDHRLRAPQPVEESIDMPAVLCATVPLESGRRHVVVDAPATREVALRAARGYADLLADCPPGPWLVDLLPSTLPGGSVELAIREELATVLPRTPFLASAADPEVRLRPQEALVLDLGAVAAAVTELLAPLAPRLVTPDHIRGGRRQAALIGLGARLLDTADTVELLGAVDATPSWWGVLIAALGGAPDRDALRALPIPLADGGIAAGPRGLVLPGERASFAPLQALDLAPRVVHPDLVAVVGAAEVLRGLGAVDMESAGLLDDVRLRDAVGAGEEGDHDPLALADAVLSLLGAAPELGASRPWLAELLLPDEDGELRPAGELVLPASYGGRLVAMVDVEGPFGRVDAALVDRHGVEAVVAAGVLRSFATLVEDDVLVAPGGLDGFLDGADEWLGDLAADLPDDGAPWVLDRVAGVRDLELVREDPHAWVAALGELADIYLPLVTEPVLALRDGARVRLEPYTAWWLRRHACVPTRKGELRRPGEIVAPEAADVLRRLLPSAADLGDSASRLVVELGVLRDVASATSDQVSLILEWMGRLAPQLDAMTVRTTYSSLLQRSIEVGCASTPGQVAAVVGDQVRGVLGIDALVIDAPDLVPLLASYAVVPCALHDAATLADLLDIDLASEAVAGAVVSRSTHRVPIDQQLVDALGADVPAQVEIHDPLLCEDAAGIATPVPWRLLDGVIYVDRGDVSFGASRALALAVGSWPRRHEIRAWLTGGPDDRVALAAEAELDEH